MRGRTGRGVFGADGEQMSGDQEPEPGLGACDRAAGCGVGGCCWSAFYQSPSSILKLKLRGKKERKSTYKSTS